MPQRCPCPILEPENVSLQGKRDLADVTTRSTLGWERTWTVRGRGNEEGPVGRAVAPEGRKGLTRPLCRLGRRWRGHKPGLQGPRSGTQMPLEPPTNHHCAEPGPGPETADLQSWKAGHVSCLNHQTCGTLSQQWQETDLVEGATGSWKGLLGATCMASRERSTLSEDDKEPPERSG